MLKNMNNAINFIKRLNKMMFNSQKITQKLLCHLNILLSLIKRRISVIKDVDNSKIPNINKFREEEDTYTEYRYKLIDPLSL